MRIVRLRMANYRRHRDTLIEFPDGVTAIVGRNGSGKTTVIEAIAFALYGTPATRTNKSLIRHDGAAAGDAVRVEMEAEVAGQALHIVRELRGANQTGTASLTVDGQTIVASQAGSSEAVTHEITRRIGLDREAFFNTICAQQKELGRLAHKSKADRKRLVLGMLGIDALDRAIQEAGIMRRNAEARVQALQERMPALADAPHALEEAKQAARSAQAEVAASERRWTSAQAALAATQGALESAREQDDQRRSLQAKHDTAAQEHRHVNAKLVDLTKRLAEAEHAAEKARGLEAAAADMGPAGQELEAALAAHHTRQRLAEAEGRVAKLRTELEACTVPPAPNGLIESSRKAFVEAQERVEQVHLQATVLATQARGVKDRLRRVAGLDGAAACPVCERPLEGHTHDLHDHLATELAEKEADHDKAQAALVEARRRLEASKAAVDEAEQAAKRHADAVAARRRVEEVLGRALEDHASIRVPEQTVDVDALRRRVEAAQQAHAQHASLMAVASRLSELAAAHDEATRRAQVIMQQVEQASAVLQALPPSALDAATKAHHEAAQTERHAERAHAGAVQAQQVTTARLEAATARKKEADDAASALKDALERHREWQVLAGVRGAGLLDRFRSHLVSRIGPAVAAEASRLLARFTGGRYTELILDDDYEVYVTEQGVPYHLERFSGGESDLVHLALRLAVSRLLVERNGGAEIRFLALDEVFGSLDEERRALVLAALQELGTLYSQVLLVTHHEDMRDALDHTLVVEETEGTAVVRMHNG